ncbi:MAG: SDR family oxidoreductase [Hyphomicrobiales bacterium]|nr:SDR family oxidoreductase [Hyphomicrobiales bacterium]
MTTMDLGTQFAGKVAVVTGGTQGLGETVARMLAARGAAGLVICGRTAERGKAVAVSLKEEGCSTEFVRADLFKLEDCRRVIAAADSVFGRVDVLVNVAALTDRGTILDTTPELFDRMFAINVRAPFFLIQDAAKIMRRDRIEGTIVNIQSMSAHGGQPFVTAYCASKAALSTLTKNAAFSLMPDRIRVNGLNIGWMDTPGEHSIQMRYHTDDAAWLANAEKNQPFGRLLKPQEVSRAVAYLASGESGMMTGSVIDFDQQVLGSQEVAPHPSGPLKDA